MLLLSSKAKPSELQFCCQDFFCAEEPSRHVKNSDCEDCHVDDSSDG